MSEILKLQKLSARQSVDDDDDDPFRAAISTTSLYCDDHLGSMQFDC